MKKLVVNALIALVFLVGAALVCYPTVSNWYNVQVNSYYIQTYQEIVDTTPYELYETMLAEARAYNATLTGALSDYVSGSAEGEAYIAALDVSNGMMGALEISAIGVSLPIYHGTDEGVLQTGIGHLEGSALPTGAAGEHTVLTGHTGLPSATLLTDLTQLELGDSFSITVLNQVYTYTVYNILVVEPYELDALSAVEGKNLATLITCTPYGINSHRLLVQGELTATETVSSTPSDADAVTGTGTGTEASETDSIPTWAKNLAMMYATTLAEGIRALGTYANGAVQALQGLGVPPALVLGAGALGLAGAIIALVWALRRRSGNRTTAKHYGTAPKTTTRPQAKK